METTDKEDDVSKYFRTPDGSIRYAKKDGGHPKIALEIVKENGWFEIYKKIYEKFEVYGSILFLEYAGCIMIDEGETEGTLKGSGRQIQYCSFALDDEATKYIENKKEEWMNDAKQNTGLGEIIPEAGDIFLEDDLYHGYKPREIVEEIVKEIKLEITKIDKRKDDDAR